MLVSRVMGRVASAFPGNVAIRLDDGPLCSFTFDDCPRSALLNGGAALGAVGAAGTFFVSAGAVKGEDADTFMWGDDLLAALEEGHELGCHTASHVSVRCLKMSELERDLEENAGAAREISPDIAFTSFAYPFGEVSIRAKSLIGNRFGVARGIRPGLNGRWVDLAELRAIGLRSETFDAKAVARLARAAVRRRSWLVFFTHDVCTNPSKWGCTPTQFQEVLDIVRTAGIAILPLKAALGRMAHRAPSS